MYKGRSLPESSNKFTVYPGLILYTHINNILQVQTMTDLGQTFVAAGIAAAVELTLLNPMDVVKTRLHLQSSLSSQTDRFKGTLNAIKEIYINEGFRGLWRGYWVGLMVVIPRRGFKFAANATFLSLLGDRLSTRHRAVLAGGLAGAFEAVIITPLEIIKIAMQSERIPRGGITARFGEVCRVIWQHSGIAGLYQGLGATVAKHAIHSCVYFSTYSELKHSVLAPGDEASSGERVRFHAGAGFAAGVSAGIVNNPFDVLKSKLQVAAASDLEGHRLAKEYAMQSGAGAALGESGKQRIFGVVGPLIRLVRTEGIGILSQGLSAKLMRLGPGSAVIFTVYESVMSQLRSI